MIEDPKDGRWRAMDRALQAERRRQQRLAGQEGELEDLRLCKACRFADPVKPRHVGAQHCNGAVPSCACACTLEEEPEEEPAKPNACPSKGYAFQGIEVPTLVPCGKTEGHKGKHEYTLTWSDNE